MIKLNGVYNIGTTMLSLVWPSLEWTVGGVLFRWRPEIRFSEKLEEFAKRTKQDVSDADT